MELYFCVLKIVFPYIQWKCLLYDDDDDVDDDDNDDDDEAIGVRHAWSGRVLRRSDQDYPTPPALNLLIPSSSS